MFIIDCLEGVNNIKFGMDDKEVMDLSRSFTDQSPTYYGGNGVHSLDYEEAGVTYMFAYRKLILIEFKDGVIAHVLGVNVKIGATTREDIKSQFGLLLDLKDVDLDTMCSDSHGLIFNFEDENNEDEIFSLWASSTTYSEHFATISRIASIEAQKNPPTPVDSDVRLALIVGITSVLDSQDVEYEIDFDPIAWVNNFTSTYSAWICRHYPVSENAALETADIIEKFSSFNKLKTSKLVLGDQINLKDKGVLCWMNPEYPAVRAAVGDLIDNLALFGKIDDRYWIVSEPVGWVIEVCSKSDIQYLFNHAAIPMLDDEFLYS